MKRFGALVCVAILAVAASSRAATLNVGPTRSYTTIQSAINAAAGGDTILVDAGTYLGSAGTMLFDGKSNITVKGNGPTRSVLDMGPDHSVSVWGKGICTITDTSRDITLENLEFIRAAGRDLPPWNDTAYNGSGIRYDGGGLLHVINCSFHDNEEGMLLTTTRGADILIEGSELYRNGAVPGPGGNAKHNIYGGGGGEGGINSFTIQHSWVYDATYAHNVKISAKTIKILYNRLGDETGNGVGNAIDIPHGGLVYVIGNMITKGAPAEDGNVLRYGEEGLWASYSKKVHILYNTFNGQRASAQTNFITLAATASPALVVNNIFHQSNPSDVLFVGASPIDATFKPYNLATWSTSIPHLWTGLVNATGPAFDYHLTGGATLAIAAAIVPGTNGLPAAGPDSFSLRPVSQYVHPLSHEGRSSDSDYGAYEHDNNPAVNHPPTVDAGQALAAIYETFGTALHAAASDADGDSLTYTWTQIGGKSATLTGANTADVSFNAPVVAVFPQAGLTFQVTVSDGRGGSATDYVDVRVFLLGDTNHDDGVNTIDLLALAGSWGKSKGNTGFAPLCDLNRDGRIDVVDLLILADNWGRTLD